MIVTSIAITNHDWWTVAGKYSGSGTGGFVSTWHGSSRSMVAFCEMCELVQALAVHHQELYLVAKEGVVSIWNYPYSLQRTHCIWTSPPSTKAIAINHHHKNNLVAVAGVGPKVDILQDHCRVQTLEL
jgi:hypothetical protein